MQKSDGLSRVSMIFFELQNNLEPPITPMRMKNAVLKDDEKEILLYNCTLIVFTFIAF